MSDPPESPLDVIDASTADEVLRRPQTAIHGGTRLTPQGARVLAQYRGVLDLSQLERPSRECVAILARGVCKAIKIHIAEWSYDAIRHFSGYCGNLYLDGETRIEEEAIRLLNGRASCLVFPSIDCEETQAIAEGLRDYGLGTKVVFDFINYPTREWFAAISNSRASFDFSYILAYKAPADFLADHYSTIRINAWEIEEYQYLAHHPGHAILNPEQGTSLTDEILEVLAQHPVTLEIPDFAPTAEQATIFSEHLGTLVLDAVTTLEPSLARAFARHSGTLVLSQLETIDLLSARALSLHEGNLWLDRLGEVSREVLETLAMHKGHLSIAQLSLIGNRLDGHRQAAIRQINKGVGTTTLRKDEEERSNLCLTVSQKEVRKNAKSSYTIFTVV